MTDRHVSVWTRFIVTLRWWYLLLRVKLGKPITDVQHMELHLYWFIKASKRSAKAAKRTAKAFIKLGKSARGVAESIRSSHD